MKMTEYKKIYISETGKRLGTVSVNTYATLKKRTRTHPNYSLGISISLINLVNI